MRLTQRGRVLLVLSALFGLAGYVLALREFTMAGTALITILAVGAVAVWARRGDVRVRRSVRPSRTNPGTDVVVELEVEPSSGRGHGAGPVLLADRVPESLGEPVRLSLGGTGRRGRRVRYTLRPPVRGRYVVGPLEIVHTDPFGTVQRTHRVPGTSSFVVYPSYERIDRVPIALQRLGVVRHSPVLGQGEEFYALRGYVEGDDLRKVHWPSSLKTGGLLVRQEELLAEPRAFVLLDTCAIKHRGRGRHSSLEAAVSACASVAMHALGRRMRVGVLTPDGPLVHGRRITREEILEALAVLEPSERSDLAPALGRLDPRSVGGAAVVVVITPYLGEAELGATAALASQSRGGAVVHVIAETFGGRPSTEHREGTAPLGRIGLPVLRLTSGDSFRRVWETGTRHVTLA